MTLIVAASNGTSIAVAADSFVYEGDGSIYRGMTVGPKIRKYGQCIIGISGRGSANNVLDYLEAKGGSQHQDIHIEVMELITRMGEVYTERRIDKDSHVLLAGFHNNEPYLATWTINNPSDIRSNPHWQAIGCGLNIALHFVARAKASELSEDQLSSVTYFSVAEVAAYDNRVNKPIDLAIITKDSTQVLDRETVRASYDERCEKISKTFYSSF
jgi:ATP-dependent protease HslVU (ClpYQ) peptidase subunit